MVIRAFISLGNPGEQYEKTFHNAGVVFAQAFEQFLNKKGMLIPFYRSASHMNQSGVGVDSAISQTNLNLADLLVIHDDSDIALGEFKLSFGRNDGGHNGIRSIFSHFKSKEFWRLRIGIRDEAFSGLKADEFVLRKMKPEHLEAIEGLCGAVYAAMIEKRLV
ncbi:MAG: aminoacyl-tRNA hydrolase [Candidatus Paceibacterota bacterium]